MTNHDKLQIFLMAQYVLLAVVAWWDGSPGKAIYFLGALILSIGLIMQKG